jgi:predicted acyltransferase
MASDRGSVDGNAAIAGAHDPLGGRLASLDMFRGLAIAGMVLVNNPGRWQHVYPPLLHAEWHGFTPTDLVFPAFLFAVGAAIPYTLAGYAGEEGGGRARLYARILRRVVLLFALGLLLNLTTPFLQWLLYDRPVDWGGLRIMGVLQRIALAYLLAMILMLAVGRGLRIAIALGVLLGYWVLMVRVPVPGVGAGVLTPEGSLATVVDRAILGQSHLYQGKFDPEGLLGTLTAAVTVLIGCAAGAWVRLSDRSSRVTLSLAAAGVSGIALGWLWDLFFPINKQLWTSSYVVYSAGWSLVLMAGCYEIADIRRWRWLAWPLQVLGVNAIVLFVASGIAARILLVSRVPDGRSVHQWLYDTLFVPWAGALNGSLAFALVTVAVWWGVLYCFCRRGWFLRL